MSTLVTLFHLLVAIYRFVVSLWNACIVLLQVVRSVIQEAKQEAAEWMALLDDGAPMMDTITSTSLLHDAGGPASPWQMLIIARASSFVLLLRLSKRRVLHLEVDEKFITSKLEVIRSGLALHVQHIPRLMPIGMHDTRLIRYTPMRLPYLWKEEQAGDLCEGGVVERSIVPAAPASSVSEGGEGRAHRKKYVQLLTESALRRRLYMDRLGRAGVDATPKRGMGVMKVHGENMVKRRALANATNVDITRGEGCTDANGASDETYGPETGVADTPKQARMERNIHAALSENLSIPNMTQAAAAASRKVDESVPQPRGRRPQSLRRKRGQFDLYAQGVSSEFSLLSKIGQGRD
ncbi:hypothetical protein J3R82DRAFT_3711 [Butyriboletus roseoflavus]|nr:hypothetical protein J3R82DRAFT_3711 [Butyriboletus roseoflavus]